MSYTPTNWKSGDIVTSDKHNKMEQGIEDANSGGGGGGGVLIVHEVDDALDHTFKEIVTAGMAVLPVASSTPSSTLLNYVPLYKSWEAEGEYGVSFKQENALFEFAATTEDGYPTVY